MPAPRPKLPPANPHLSCAVSAAFSRLPAFFYGQPVVLTDGPGGPTSGAHFGQKIDLKKAAGVNPPGIELTGSLALIATGNITVDTPIRFPTQAVPGTPNVNLLIVSLNGAVVIKAPIGGGRAAPGADDTTDPAPLTQAEPGTNGGFIQIVGITVDIAARIDGNGGGPGGTAGPNHAPAPGGAVMAVGGGGGHGGDIFICAFDAMRIAGIILGAKAGAGGAALVRADRRAVGHAIGGPAGDSGSVLLAASSALCQLTVAVNRGVRPPLKAAVGGTASVDRGPNPPATPPGEGGRGTSVAGAGSDGMEVLIDGKMRVLNLGFLRPGKGGMGGDADAEGGSGSAGNPGEEGGDAHASGGPGGERGVVGPYLTLAGVQVPQVLGDPGGGGRGVARPGDGGRGQGPNARGGESGRAKAIGGANGDGTKAPDVPRTAADPPNGNQGGRGANADAQAPGAP